MRDPGCGPVSRSPSSRTSARPATLPQPVRPLALPALLPFRQPGEGKETTRGCRVWADWLGVRPSGPGD